MSDLALCRCDAALCQCDQLCPGECCGIPCCFTIDCGLWAKFIPARTNCVVNVTKLYMLLQFLLVVLTHFIAFYLGRYFCFDGVASTDCFSDDPAATEESAGAGEEFGTG